MDIKELVESGDVSAVRAALAAGLSPTEVIDNRTLLHFAVAKGKPEIVRAVAEAARDRGQSDLQPRCR